MHALMLLMASAIAAPTADEAPLPVREVISLSQYVHRHPNVDWSKYRALSFSHFQNEQDQRDYRIAAKFAIETMNRITKEAEIYVFGDLWLVNTQKLNWPAAAWDDMSQEWEYYQYLPKEPIAYLNQKMGTKFPIMRADVFIKDCWKPAWYEQFLNLPDSRGKLWDQLGLGADWLEYAYLGITENSDVASHGRKFARTSTPADKGDLAVWVVMGYEDERGKNDCSKYPLNMDCHYNEIAFGLKNGLVAYYANRGGVESSSMNLNSKIRSASMDKPRSASMDMDGSGDWGIIRNLPTRVGIDFHSGGNIVLGQSCISCHMDGLKSLDGKLASLDTLDFGNGQWSMNKVQRHFRNERLAQLANEDLNSWRQSVKRLTGADAETVSKAWQRVQKEFDQPINLETAARELGISQYKLRTKIEEQPVISPELQRLINNETISRVDWEHAFGDVMDMFRHETQLAVIEVYGHPKDRQYSSR